MINKVEVPTFLVGGEYDLFQRGTPLLFENLQKQRRPGPDDHRPVGPPRRARPAPTSARPATARCRSCGCAGSTTTSRARRTRGSSRTSRRSPTTSRAAASGTTQEVRGQGPSAASYRLSGQRRDRRRQRRADADRRREPGTSTCPPIPVSGLCTRSANQWTAGLLNARLAGQPVPARQRAQRQGRPGLPDAEADQDAALPGTDQRPALHVAPAATGCSRCRSRTSPRTARSPG